MARWEKGSYGWFNLDHFHRILIEDDEYEYKTYVIGCCDNSKYILYEYKGIDNKLAKKAMNKLNKKG